MNYKPQECAELVRRLSPAQRIVLRGIAEAKKPNEIAEELHISSKGVEWHRTRIYRVLGVVDRVQATRLAIGSGMLL